MPSDGLILLLMINMVDNCFYQKKILMERLESASMGNDKHADIIQ